MRLFRYASLLVFAIPLVFAQDIVTLGQQVPTPGGAKGRPATSNRYIVQFRPGTSQMSRAIAAQQAGAALQHNYVNMDFIAVLAPNPNALNALRSNSAVVSVTPARMMYTMQKGKPGGGGGGGGTPTPGGTRQIVSM